MADILGTGLTTPTIDISGWLSGSWMYVLIVAMVGLVLIGAIATMLFFSTYKKKVIIFENISGAGYQPTLRTRARMIKLGIGGEAVMKTLAGGDFLSAYGRKMGKNTYWFARGQDGYLYNFLLGDLDTKLSILDVEPVDRDVRMLHTALNKLAAQNYAEKKSFMDMYAPYMILFILMIGLIVGGYIQAGKINEGIAATGQAANVNAETASLLNQIANKIDVIKRGGSIDSGIVPVTEIDSND